MVEAQRCAGESGRSRRRRPVPHTAGVGVELLVFRAQAHLDGVALQPDLILRQRQRLATRHADLPLDQVQPGQRLGHRVLDLQPGVHLHQIEVRPVQQELHRARAHVAGRSRQRHGALAQALAQGGVHRRAGRFLDDLLVPALHRAIALAQVDDLAVRVGEHLHLHVARIEQRALDQQVAMAEAGQCLGARAGQRRRQLRGLLHQPHAAPAAAGHRLHHHRVADALGLGGEARLGLVVARVAGQAGHAVLRRQRLGRRLAAQRADRRRWRADPGQAGILHRLGKAGVLAQEAVARVHRVGAGGPRGFQQTVHAQVALGRRAAAQRERQRGLAHVQRPGVGLRIHGHRLDPHAPRRGDHAARDLATVGDQNPFHRNHPFHRMAAEQAKPANAVPGPAPGTGVVPPPEARSAKREGGRRVSDSGGCLISRTRLIAPAAWPRP